MSPVISHKLIIALFESQWEATAKQLMESTLVCQLSLVLQVIHRLAFLIDVINSDKSWWQEP